MINKYIQIKELDFDRILLHQKSGKLSVTFGIETEIKPILKKCESIAELSITDHTFIISLSKSIKLHKCVTFKKCQLLLNKQSLLLIDAKCNIFEAKNLDTKLMISKDEIIASILLHGIGIGNVIKSISSLSRIVKSCNIIKINNTELFCRYRRDNKQDMDLQIFTDNKGDQLLNQIKTFLKINDSNDFGLKLYDIQSMHIKPAFNSSFKIHVDSMPITMKPPSMRERFDSNKILEAIDDYSLTSLKQRQNDKYPFKILTKVNI